MTTNTVKHTLDDERLEEIRKELRRAQDDWKRWNRVRDAAPDLLEALQNALASGLPDFVADAARSAISKATGSPAPQEKGGE